jgi:hypothetical protein
MTAFIWFKDIEVIIKVIGAALEKNINDIITALEKNTDCKYVPT